MDLNTLAKLSGLPPPGTEVDVAAKLAECAEIMNYEHPMPTVSYDLRGQVGGYAHYARNHIQLNVDMLHNHYDEMINQTLPHEFAHLISVRLYGYKGKGHGVYWKHVMRQLGLTPDRCHSMTVEPARITKKYKFRCSCRTMMIGATRYKRYMRGEAVYRCSACGSAIHPVKEDIDADN